MHTNELLARQCFYVHDVHAVMTAQLCGADLSRAIIAVDYTLVHVAWHAFHNFSFLLQLHN